MPRQHERPECARAYRAALGRGSLYLPGKPLVSWRSERIGVTCRLIIEGMPLDPITSAPMVGFVSLSIGGLIPLLSASIIWEGERIYGIDMGGGTAHKDASGRPVFPPHRHFYRPDGRKECDRLDLLAAGIKAYDDHERAMRYFFEWTGLNGSAVQWQDPPNLQLTLLPGTLPTY